MTRTALLLTLVGSLAFAACGAEEPAPRAAADAPSISAAGPSYGEVDVAELQAMLANKDFPLINVHVPFQGDLPGTDLSIPYDQIASRLDELPADKDAPIVLYCRSGSMSDEAAATLAELGYTDVVHLEGGFNAWQAAGLPMADG